MLQNAYFLAKIGADTAENEQHFAENLPIGRRVAEPDRRGSDPPEAPSYRGGLDGLRQVACFDTASSKPHHSALSDGENNFF